MAQPAGSPGSIPGLLPVQCFNARLFETVDLLGGGNAYHKVTHATCVTQRSKAARA